MSVVHAHRIGRPQAGLPAAGNARLAGVFLLVGVATTHALDLEHKLQEAPYMAVLFGALITACCLLSVLLVDETLAGTAWVVGASMCAMTVAGYVLSRSVGLPQIEDHVGMWWEPYGVASVVCELGFIALALSVHSSQRVSAP